MIDKTFPQHTQPLWEDYFQNDVQTEKLDWEETHVQDFKCITDTQLTSFYFKIFQRVIAFNNYRLINAYYLLREKLDKLINSH